MNKIYNWLKSFFKDIDIEKIYNFDELLQNTQLENKEQRIGYSSLINKMDSFDYTNFNLGYKSSSTLI